MQAIGARTVKTLAQLQDLSLEPGDACIAVRNARFPFGENRIALADESVPLHDARHERGAEHLQGLDVLGKRARDGVIHDDIIAAPDPRADAATSGGTARESLHAPQRPQIEAVEQHRQPAHAKLDQRGVVGAGKAEGPRLEALVPEGEPVTVPVEDLEAVAAARSEDEEVAAGWVLADHGARHLGESIEPATHVRGRDGEPDARHAAVELRE